MGWYVWFVCKIKEKKNDFSQRGEEREETDGVLRTE
jgi:hypothetical protein